MRKWDGIDLPEPHLVSPYGSALILESATTIDKKQHIKILNAVKEIILEKLDGIIDSKKIENFPDQFFYEIEVRGFTYIINEACNWNNLEKNKLNELILILTNSNYLAIYTSNTDHRAIILNSIPQNVNLQNLKKIPSAELINAFLISEELKAIWMSGTHKVVDVKADSKVLSGKNLEHALDPLSDSTYLASAVKAKKIGIALRNSVVWTKSNKNLDEFTLGIDKIFQCLRGNKKGQAQLPILASELSTFKNVAGVYDFEVGPPESFVGKKYEKAENLIDIYNFAVSSCVHSNKCCFNLEIISKHSTRDPIQIHLEPTFQNYSTDIAFSIDPPSNANLLYKPIYDALLKSPELFRIFYESGHTISAGALAVSSTKDQKFRSWLWGDFKKVTNSGIVTTDVKKEKPNGNNLSLIWTDPDEDSIFSWLVTTLSDPTTASTIGLNPLSTNNDVWLFCDDGAGEIADFVHLSFPKKPIAENPPTLTLIHIKGANSSSVNRKMTAGPFEILCAQAIKNIRYIDRSIIADRLAERALHLDRPLWNEPLCFGNKPQGTHEDFYGLLQCLPSEIIYKVLIVQPHLTESATQLNRNLYNADPKNLGAAQLRSLLFTTENSAKAVGAIFTAIGSK